MSTAVGSPGAFGVAALSIVVWLLTGPIFGYTDAWQLVVNTGTTIITFLMVFLIQHAQNRDSAAVHMKLDELIRVNQKARDRVIGAAQLSQKELNELRAEFEKLAKRPRADPVGERD